MPEFETICPSLDLLGLPQRKPYHRVLVLRAFQPWQEDRAEKLTTALGMVGLGRDHFTKLFVQTSLWEDQSSHNISDGFGIEAYHQIIYALGGRPMLSFTENHGVYLTEGSLAIIPAGTPYCWYNTQPDFKFRSLRLG